MVNRYKIPMLDDPFDLPLGIRKVGTEVVLASDYDKLERAVSLFVKQWNACGPNGDFGRYFQNVKDAVDAAIGSVSIKEANATVSD